ncbi:MAG: DUF1064 domain-containing protein [Chloroflexota bacterium]
MTERITAAAARAMMALTVGPDKRRVRGTRRVKYQGQWFDSKHERDQFIILADREKRGEIRGLRRQVAFMLLGKDGPILTPTGRPMEYRADFTFWDVLEARERVLDAKGHPTDTYLIKKAILAAQGVLVEEV